MIELSYNITTGAVKITTPATIKVGADVPVRLTFSGTPGEVTAVKFALGSDATDPEVLAYTEDFEAESGTVWLATLDANDSRLVAFMDEKGTTKVNAELLTTIDGVNEVSGNLEVTVQKAIVTGPTATEGGPSYYTEAEADAAFAAKTVAGKYRIKTDGTFQLWNATQSKWHTLILSGAAGAEVLAIGAGES